MLQDLLEERIAILDGAMATRIQAYALSEAHYRGAEFRNHDAPVMGNYEMLSITQLDLIRSIHLEYLEAGADIITTNTFRANLLSMGGYGLAENVYAVNLAAAELASSVRDRVEKAVPNRPRFVAGAVSAPDAPAEAYAQQVLGLLDGGVDVLLLETVFDTRNAIAALDAFDQCFSTRGASDSCCDFRYDQRGRGPAFGRNDRGLLAVSRRARRLCCRHQLFAGPERDGISSGATL